MTIDETLKILMAVPEDERGETLLTVQVGVFGHRRRVTHAKRTVHRASGQPELRLVAWPKVVR